MNKIGRPPHIESWPISAARANIGGLFDAAIKSGPQKVTRRNSDAVVVISEQEFLRLRNSRPSFADYLLNCPLNPDDLPKRQPARILQNKVV